MLTTFLIIAAAAAIAALYLILALCLAAKRGDHPRGHVDADKRSAA